MENPSDFRLPLINFLKNSGYDVKLGIKIGGKKTDIAAVREGHVVVIESGSKEDEIPESVEKCAELSKAANQVYLALASSNYKNLINPVELDKVPFGVMKVGKNGIMIIKKSKEFKPKKAYLEKTVKALKKQKKEQKEDLKKSIWLRRLENSMTSGNVWMYVLSLLSKMNRCHAYALTKEIRKEFGFNPSLISVYRAAYTLEYFGYIRPQSIGNRKYYIITESGRRYLKEAIKFLKYCISMIK